MLDSRGGFDTDTTGIENFLIDTGNFTGGRDAYCFYGDLKVINERFRIYKFGSQSWAKSHEGLKRIQPQNSARKTYARAHKTEFKGTLKYCLFGKPNEEVEPHELRTVHKSADNKLCILRGDESIPIQEKNNARATEKRLNLKTDSYPESLKKFNCQTLLQRK